MAKISKDLVLGTLHPRENLYNSTPATLGALNAEVIIDSHGASTVSLDLRGTFVGTVEVSGTIDGTNWILIPIRQQQVAGTQYLAGATTLGSYVAKCSQYRQVRARMTAYTSGAATTVIHVSNGLLDDSLNATITPLIVTTTAAISNAATLTIPAPSAGLRNYITYLRIVKFAGAALTAAATPVLVTTTNLPGSPVFSLPADAAAQGTVFAYQEDFSYPIASSALATATTIVAPLTTGVIWRITVGYYVAP